MYKILIFLFLLLSFSAFAKVDSLVVKNDNSTVVQKKFNNNNLEKYKADKDFNYEEDINEENSSFFRKLFSWFGRQISRFLEWVFGVKYAQGILSSILSAIPYIIAALVLFLLLKFFLKVNSNAIVSNAKNKSLVSISEEEEFIKNKDILLLIQQAIEQENYRLAVRYSYLNTLKQLENNQRIVWEQQKTNEDYIKEISSQNIKNSFENLTRLYDFVWYGNFNINKTEFAQIELDFKQTNNLIIK